MSLFFKSYKLSKIYDEKYSDHYISRYIFNQWGKDLHEFPQFDLNKLKFDKLKDRSLDVKNIKYFVNSHFKNKILKSVCVISIEKNRYFLDYRLVEREITLFLKSFKTCIKDYRLREELKYIDNALFSSLMDYIDGYLLNTYSNSWKSLN